MVDDEIRPLDTPDAHPEYVKELPAAIRQAPGRLTLAARVDALERRLDEVIAVQVANTPIFKAALDRILRMRETLHSHGNSLMRLEALATKAVSSQEMTAASITELVTMFQYAKTWSGRMRKYWPRIATFFFGVAIAKGWITAENGHNFMHIFGL